MVDSGFTEDVICCQMSGVDFGAIAQVGQKAHSVIQSPLTYSLP